VAGRNIFSSEERTSHFFEILSFTQQSANWNLFKTFCSTFTKKFRFFFQKDYLLLINYENSHKKSKKIKKKYNKNRKNPK